MTRIELVEAVLDLAPGIQINNERTEYDLAVQEYRARIMAELPKLLKKLE